MRTRARIVALVAPVALVASVGPVGSAAAFTYATDGAGTAWGVQDASAPGTDTGSIRATQLGTGVLAPYSTLLNGYGGIRVTTSSPVEEKDRFDGELLRGFGLTEAEPGRFETVRSVDLGGARVSRSVDISEDARWGRWLDTFTNRTRAPLTLEVAFGGQTGYGSTGTTASGVVRTSDGDADVTPSDVWTASASGTAEGRTTGGPTATVVGEFDRTGNWLRDTFTEPMGTQGHDANFPAYVSTMTLAPLESASLLHFVVVGQPVTPETLEAELDAVSATAADLAGAPVLDGLSADEVCSITNVPGLTPADAGLPGEHCRGRGPTLVRQPFAPRPAPPTTRSPYDVVDATIGEVQADMEAGRTTSAQITRAYLDRIAAYDEGQLGFNAYITVADDAMRQARRADRARARGTTGALLGIPIAVKDLYDTADMPTTNGSLTFEGFRPREDAFQVARLREAGAVILGKASMEEYATSGSYSDSAYGTVWNAFDPSRSALASSGGSAVATATSMAAAALGSQTGDSLYAPATAASLVTLRGTDGMQSDRGVMPLVWLQDYAGSMARTVDDLADVLNVTSGTDPQNPETAEADRYRPQDWRSVLDADALRGKRIGLLPEAWEDPYGTTKTVEASRDALGSLEAAGAEVVELPQGPVAPPRPRVDANWEGWARYLESHPELSFTSPAQVVCSQDKLPYTRYPLEYCDGRERMTPAEVAAWRGYRSDYKDAVGAWMDEFDLDAVVYPALLSEISLNDGGGNRSSFGRRDTPSGSSGVPTVAFPAGTDADGAPVSLQLLGRAWSDAELVGMAYAFEQVADGHVAPDTAPPLPRAGG